jgi:hypothetical protein
MLRIKSSICVNGNADLLQLGCGTALPSLALLQWSLESSITTLGEESTPLYLGLADYNPTVLQLVTLPNLILSWAQVTKKGSWDAEGELDLDEELIHDLLASLSSHGIELNFFSGAWSPDFVNLVTTAMGARPARLTIIGAETIYSPAALRSFADTLASLLESMPGRDKSSLVAAKMVYFGVGGTMEDFCNAVREKSLEVTQIREESEGVRRAVVEVKLIP